MLNIRWKLVFIMVILEFLHLFVKLKCPGLTPNPLKLSKREFKNFIFLFYYLNTNFAGHLEKKKPTVVWTYPHV